MKQLFLKPAVPGNLVRDPYAPGMKPLDQQGEWKPATPYWLRRVRFGDAVVCDPPKKVKVEKGNA